MKVLLKYEHGDDEDVRACHSRNDRATPRDIQTN